MADPRYLDGVTVLETGGTAAAVAGDLLAALGARVVTVPDGACPPGARFTGTRGERPVLDAVLDRRKQVVDPAAGPVDPTSFDVVLAENGLGTGDPVPDGVVLVDITPFGLDGPRSKQAAGELLLQAAGGLLGTVEGADGAPVPVPASVVARAVGTVAALAALHGLDRRRRSGQAVHVDVSAQEALIATAALPECAHVLYRCPGRAGSGRYLAPSGLFPCADGMVRIAAVENHQWGAMVRALGAPEWTQGLEERAARIEHAGLITEHVTAWTRGQEKAACAELLQRHGVPATPVHASADLLGSPQLRHRERLTGTDLDGVPGTVLEPPWRLAEGDGSPGAGPSGPDGPDGLAGLRVTELTHVLAGPIVGALLGAMGADVTRLEDPDRLDIYRRSGPFADGRAGVERGAYFAVANHSKRSVLIDPGRAADDVSARLTGADVLIENVGSSRLDRLGVDPAGLAAGGTLVMRVSGFGSDGPEAGWRAYANNVQAYGGLAWATRDGAGDPARLGTVIADPLSSVTAALVIAAWALGGGPRRGAVADLSMAEVVASTVAGEVAAASLPDAARRPDAERAPFALHRAADDRWVVVETGDVAAEAATSGASPDGQGPDGPAGLRDLAGLIAGLPAAEAVERLAGSGIPAAVVLRGADLVADEHLAVRGFFPVVTHPDPELGRARLVGLPWRFAGEGPVVLTPPPALGSGDDRSTRSSTDA